MTSRSKLALSLLLWWAASSTAPAAESATAGSLESRVAQIFAKVGTPAEPGCAVGLFDRGRSVLTHGYGVADIESHRAIDGNTLFYAASNSKEYTALAVAKLVEAGKLKLSDDIRTIVPELPDYGTPITIQMLLNHTSGLGSWFDRLQDKGLTSAETVDMPTVLDIVSKETTLKFPPGTDYAYSNSGYFLLALAVQRLSGQPFADFVRKKVFGPLGMKHSYVRNGPVRPPSAKPPAHGYIINEQGQFLVRDTYPSIGGSGGAMITLNDLRKLDQDFHRGRKVWTPRTRELLLTPGVFANGEQIVRDGGSSYGGGLGIGTWHGQKVVEHSGAAEAFKSKYTRFPDLGISVAVFCNRGDVDVGALSGEVILAWRPKDFPSPAAAD